jgi:hypothetical protein
MKQKSILVSIIILGLVFLCIVGCQNNNKEFSTKFFSKSDQKNCENQGGIYGKYGMAQLYQCNMPTTDAGVECYDSEECEGLCLADGTCSPFLINFGCTPILKDGENVTICID